MKTKKRPLDLTIECRGFRLSDWGWGRWKRISGEEGEDEVSYGNHWSEESGGEKEGRSRRMTAWSVKAFSLGKTGSVRCVPAEGGVLWDGRKKK